MCMTSWSKLTVVNECFAPKHYFSDAKWKNETPIQDILLILYFILSIIWCKCYSKHDGQLSQLWTVLCPWSSLFYWVLRLRWVPILMFLQLIDVYFDCKSRNECWEKVGNKSAHLFYMYCHFLFLKQCIIFYEHRDFIPV